MRPKKSLMRAAGRFVYPRGSDLMLHFMELKDAQIVDGPVLAQLFMVRSLRLRMAEQGDLDTDLTRWMHGTGTEQLARLTIDVAINQPDSDRDRIAITEFYPGLGLHFEHIKYRLTEIARQTGSAPAVFYQAVGQPSYKDRFDVLHDEPAFPANFREETAFPLGDLSARAIGRSDLVVFNQNQGVYDTEVPGLALGDVLPHVTGPMVVSLRVSATPRPQTRTTVGGREVRLPAFDGVREQLRRVNAAWRYRLIPEFDASFFLPETGQKTSLLFAYRGGLKREVDGYEML